MLRFWSGHSCDSRGLTKSSRNHCHWGRGIVTRLISRYVWSTARSETLKLSRVTINNYWSHLHEYSEWCHGEKFPPSVNLLIPKLYFYLLHSPTHTFNYFLSSRNFTKFQQKNEWLAITVATDAFVIDRNSAPLTVSEEILGDQATTSDSDDNVPLGRVHRNRRFVDEDSDDAHWEE